MDKSWQWTGQERTYSILAKFDVMCGNNVVAFSERSSTSLAVWYLCGEAEQIIMQLPWAVVFVTKGFILIEITVHVWLE